MYMSYGKGHIIYQVNTLRDRVITQYLLLQSQFNNFALLPKSIQALAIKFAKYIYVHIRSI